MVDIKQMLLLLLLLGALVACRPEENAPGGVLDSVPPLAAVAGTVVPTPPPLLTLDPTSVTLGEEVYATHCASCHGANLEGEADWKQQNEDDTFRAPPHDETGHTWHHADKLLIDAVLLGGARLPDNIGGVSEMPAFQDLLSETEVAAVLDYIKNSWPDDLRAIQWQQTSAQP